LKKNEFLKNFEAFEAKKLMVLKKKNLSCGFSQVWHKTTLFPGMNTSKQNK